LGGFRKFFYYWLRKRRMLASKMPVSTSFVPVAWKVEENVLIPVKWMAVTPVEPVEAVAEPVEAVGEPVAWKVEGNVLIPVRWAPVAHVEAVEAVAEPVEAVEPVAEPVGFVESAVATLNAFNLFASFEPEVTDFATVFDDLFDAQPVAQTMEERLALAVPALVEQVMVAETLEERLARAAQRVVQRVELGVPEPVPEVVAEVVAEPVPEVVAEPVAQETVQTEHGILTVIKC
jgi:hypothetical protein